MACSAVDAPSRSSQPSTPATPASSLTATETPRCAAAQGGQIAEHKHRPHCYARVLPRACEKAGLTTGPAPGFGPAIQVLARAQGGGPGLWIPDHHYEGHSRCQGQRQGQRQHIKQWQGSVVVASDGIEVSVGVSIIAG